MIVILRITADTGSMKRNKDEKVKTSISDTETGYLNEKINSNNKIGVEEIENKLNLTIKNIDCGTY